MKRAALPIAVLAGIGAAGLASAQPAAAGQGRLVLTPKLNLAAVYDGNVLREEGGPSDWISRTGVGGRLDWRWTERRTLGLSYETQAQGYLESEGLSELVAHQRFSLAVGQQLSERTSTTVGADFQQSRLPGEILESTGLAFERGTARGYGVSLSVERTAGKRMAWRAGYGFRRMELPGSSRDDSHGLQLGITRRLGQSLSIALQGGPRQTALGVRGEGTASARWDLRRGALSLAGGVTDNAAPGDGGRLRTTGVGGGFEHELGRRLALAIKPAYFWTSAAGQRWQAARVGTTLSWKWGRHGTAAASCQYSEQRASSVAPSLPGPLVHNLCAFDITFAPAVRLN